MRGRLERAASDPVYMRYRKAFLSARSTGGGPSPVTYPRVAVYTGTGASHSWIWFADLLERAGLFDVVFVGESGILGRALESADVLLVGGGDTYAIAESLGAAGARAILSFVLRGGLYYGSCAGAYLVLAGVDREPFAPFKLVRGSMANVMEDPPPPRCLEHKYLAPYGECWVFHPVYGEVTISVQPAARSIGLFKEGKAISAPLFGGPIISGVSDREVLARYSGLTGRAAYLWPVEDARRLVAGKAAVVYALPGEGAAVASGPHLEHPLFPQANALVAEVLLAHCEKKRVSGGRGHPPAYEEKGRERPCGTGVEAPGTATDRRIAGSAGRGGPGTAAAVLEIRRQLSNSRIVGFGLEKMPVTWKIGQKVWEPEKIRMFLEVAWRRLDFLQREAARVPLEALEAVAEGYAGVTGMVKSLGIKVESGEDSSADAFSLLNALKELTATFLLLYFRLRLDE